MYERELKGKGEERHGIVVGLPRVTYQDDDIKHRHEGLLPGHGEGRLRRKIAACLARCVQYCTAQM